MNEAVLYISSDYGSLWLGNGVGTYPWSSVASSADGRRLAACAKGPGDIWTSVDGGSNWTYRVPENGLAWAAIASSADGSRLAACAATPSGGGGVFTTINWNPVGTTYGGGDIYTTTNGGATWTERHWPSPKPRWNGICSSLDGSFLAACSDDYIYLSNDSGETWTAQTTAPQLHWASICCSSDGDHVAALAGNGSVYTAQ